MSVKRETLARAYASALGRRLILFLAAHDLVQNRLRISLMLRAGILIDGAATVNSGARISGEGTIRIGRHTFINNDCTLDAAADISIGESVALGNRVMLITSSHKTGNARHRAGARILRSIEIMDGAWLGAGAIVLGGVTIGRGAVVGAGSVVTRDCVNNGLYLGTPARLVRNLGDTAPH